MPVPFPLPVSYGSFMTSPWRHWVFTESKFHRLKPGGGQTLCGEKVQGLRVIQVEEVRQRVESDRITVCGRCDKRLSELVPVTGIVPPRRALTPEQQVIRDRLDEERWKRAQARADAERLQRSSSRSVRAVSGGLPTLGKKHR